ncbi:class I SAM-dependent methyltransferase [Candidatus Bathyarchaeota archaeon]|nr:class I SAM-dependent methyltransferase [Candidatus Bathyarchaeota archaeon]
MGSISILQLVAVDISGDLLEKARLRRLPPEQVTFLKKRFEDCDVDGPFDAVIGSSVLHHLEIGPALRRICQLLRPGGVMSFAEPNMRNPQVFAERRLRFLFPRVSPDETAFVRGRLAKLLAGTGFEDVEVVPHGWLHPAVPAFCVGPTERIEAALEAIPLIREFSGSLYIRARRPMSNRTARRCPRAHDERVSSR